MRRTRPSLIVLVLALGVAGCAGSGGADEPDRQFGQRPDNDDSETLLITPPDSTGEFFYYPAYASEVIIRSGPAADGLRPVELLIKGALPDACTELHDIRETQKTHLIELTFETRRPKGAVCAQVVRPFRFYYILGEPLAPGDYTLKLNDAVHPFTVQPLPEQE